MHVSISHLVGQKYFGGGHCPEMPPPHPPWLRARVTDSLALPKYFGAVQRKQLEQGTVRALMGLQLYTVSERIFLRARQCHVCHVICCHGWSVTSIMTGCWILAFNNTFHISVETDNENCYKSVNFLLRWIYPKFPELLWFPGRFPVIVEISWFLPFFGYFPWKWKHWAVLCTACYVNSYTIQRRQ